MTTSIVLDAVEQAIWTRARAGVVDLAGLVHHNDRGSRADSSGRRNTSCGEVFHVVSGEGVLRWSAAAGCGPGDPARAAVPGPAAAVSGCGAGVLAVDRPGRLQ